LNTLQIRFCNLQFIGDLRRAVTIAMTNFATGLANGAPQSSHLSRARIGFALERCCVLLQSAHPVFGRISFCCESLYAV
jgi:hypothetical protein